MTTCTEPAGIPAADGNGGLVPGAGLRSWLDRADMSPEQLAGRLNALASEAGLRRTIEAKTPYKWLRGAVPRHPWPALTAHLLSARLGTAVTAEDLGWPGTRPAPGGAGPGCLPADAGLDLPWTVPGARRAVITATQPQAMTADFLPVTGAMLTGPALGWLTAGPPGGLASDAGPAVSGGHVTAIGDMTAGLRLAGDEHGSALVLPQARALLGSVTAALTQTACSEADGARLHAAAAELLRLAGWLSLDAGLPGQAQRYWLAALRPAHAAGDRGAGANLLRSLSSQASAAGQHPEAVTLAEAARRGAGPGLTPRAAAVLAFGAALAHARAGDRAATQAAVTDAWETLGTASPDTTEPGWARWLDRAAVCALTGTASLYLRDWDQARHHLTTALRALSPGQPRARAIIHARLGQAHAGQGNPEPASEHGTAAIRILTDSTTSARCLTDLRDLRHALHPYRSNRAVASFARHLARIDTSSPAGGDP
jgi:tetratricopeptide (TPR) repeat protein